MRLHPPPFGATIRGRTGGPSPVPCWWRMGRGRYGDGGGLYLLIRSPEARFWLFRYTLPGAKMRELGLGRAGGPGAVTLAEARQRAADLYPPGKPRGAPP